MKWRATWAPDGSCLWRLMWETRPCKSAVAGTLDRFGKLDVLVNSTYFRLSKRVEELSWQEFDKAMHINLTGTLGLAREAAGVMCDGGSHPVRYMYGLVAPNLRNCRRR